MARLAAFVHVDGPDGPTVLGPDDDVPNWAVELISNPKAWAEPPTAEGGYAGMRVPDLKAELEKRNVDREEDALLPVDGKKGDLVAALEADDESA
jgi:hypothetical protein